jgi:Ankyrin repeat
MRRLLDTFKRKNGQGSNEQPDANNNIEMIPAEEDVVSPTTNKMIEDDDNDEEEVEDDESDDEALTLWQTIKYNFRLVKKEIFKEVVDYGPPYVDNATLLPLSLVDECAMLQPNLLIIHNMLNSRANPNSPDIHDFNFTPLHWICKKNILAAVKMLIEAHANVNAVNELVLLIITFLRSFNHKLIGSYSPYASVHASSQG